MSSSPEEALWSFQEAHTLVRLCGFGGFSHSRLFYRCAVSCAKTSLCPWNERGTGAGVKRCGGQTGGWMGNLNFGSFFLQADTIGSAPIAALCQALAAEVHGRRGESEAAANALQQATDAADGADNPAAAPLWHAASFPVLLACGVMVCTYLLQEQPSTTCMPCCVRALFNFCLPQPRQNGPCRPGEQL